MEVALEKRPIYTRKLLNNTKFGIGWRNKDGMPKFVICYWYLWLRYGGGVGNASYICKKILYDTKFGIGWRNKAGIMKFVIQVSGGVCC